MKFRRSLKCKGRRHVECLEKRSTGAAPSPTKAVKAELRLDKSPFIPLYRLRGDVVDSDRIHAELS
jgi:hypothetical protein